jgi:hypothetical protein
MRIAILFLAVGCSRGFEPPSTFVGKTEENATVEIDGEKPGSWKTSRKKDDVVVKVERAGKKQLRITIDGCTVLAEQNENDEQVAMTSTTPPQSCELDVDHFKGPTPVFGSFAFDKQRGTLKLNLSAAPPPFGSKTRVTYLKFYDGVAKK